MNDRSIDHRIRENDCNKMFSRRLTENNEHLVIQSHRVPIIVMWTPSSVTLMLDTVLQGRVTGVCGHIDNMHKEKLPKIYTVTTL